MDTEPLRHAVENAEPTENITVLVSWRAPELDRLPFGEQLKARIADLREPFIGAFERAVRAAAATGERVERFNNAVERFNNAPVIALTATCDIWRRLLDQKLFENWPDVAAGLTVDGPFLRPSTGAASLTPGE